MTTKITAIIPKDLNEVGQLSAILQNSTLLPKAFMENKKNVPVAIIYGLELGLTPAQALNSIAVVNGKPSLYGDAPLALVKKSGLLEYIKEYRKDDTGYCEVKRKDELEPVKTKFSLEDAKRAGLLTNKRGEPVEVWAKYPDRMLQMRARGLCLRDAFPDVLLGVHQENEVEVNEVVEVKQEPKEIAVAQQLPPIPNIKTNEERRKYNLIFGEGDEMFQFTDTAVVFRLFESILGGSIEKVKELNKNELIRWKQENPKYYKYFEENKEKVVSVDSIKELFDKLLKLEEVK